MRRQLSTYGYIWALVLGAGLIQFACGRSLQPGSATPTPDRSTPLPATLTALKPSVPAPTSRSKTPPAAGTVTPGTQAEPLSDAGQEAAMLPDTRQDLEALRNLNRYSIRVDIDYAGHSFAGSERVDITNREAVALDRLYFRLLPNGGKSYGGGWLDVSRTAVDGQPVEIHLSLSDTVLEVPLAEPLEVGESLQVEFDFSGVVPIDFGSDADGENGYGIYNFTDGVLALSGWYPILAVYDEQGWNLDPVSAIGDSVYSDSALYTVGVTAADDLVLATTGIEIEAGNARRYASGPVRDFFMIMSPEFEVVSQEADGARINSFYLPGNEQAGEKALEVAAGSLQVYNQRFGPYPYEELDVVEAPMQNALGVEYPGIVLVSSDLYADPSEFTFAVATAHEVAHQWWYGVIGNDVFDEPWLDEGLATYSSNVYFQQAEGEETYQGYAGYWNQRLQELRDEGRDDVVTRSLSYFENQENGSSYGTVVYTKGALFFKALREEIGDQAFFSGLQSYYQDHKYGIARTDALLEAFKTAAGRPLDDLYQEWLYSAQE